MVVVHFDGCGFCLDSIPVSGNLDPRGERVLQHMVQCDTMNQCRTKKATCRNNFILEPFAP